MPTATNDNGDVVYLDPSGQWQPAKTATNADGDRVAFDGTSWQTVKNPAERAAAGNRQYVSDLVGNIPKSASKAVENMVEPFLDPAKTVDDLKSIGTGVLQKFGIMSGDDKEKYADAVGQFFKNRYGGWENIKKTLKEDPVGTMLDLSTVLSAGGSAAARAPGTVGKIGDALKTAGDVTSPLTPVVNAGKAVGGVAAEGVGMLTGVGGKALKEAGAAGAEALGSKGQDFLKTYTGAAGADEPVKDAVSAVNSLRQERGALYRESMAGMKENQTPLNFDKVDKAIQDAWRVDFFKGQDLKPKTAEVKSEVIDAVNEWSKLPAAEFHTPEGMDALKKKLGTIVEDNKDPTGRLTSSGIVASAAYKAVRQTIIDEYPEYAKIMKGYEEATNTLKEIESTLSLKPNANIDTSLRKLQSVLRNNVNSNYGRRSELADFLQANGAENLIAKLSGQSLNAWTPRGLGPLIAGEVGLGLPHMGQLALLPLSSPKLSGGAAFAFGAAGRVAPTLAEASFQAGRPRGLTP